MKKIVFIGYMGCGKTSVAGKVSEMLDMAFLDLDQIIESDQKMSIKELFDSKGEVHFRKLEHFLFSDKMTNSESFVLSTGGGTPCYANNHLLLEKENVISIYLKASVQTLAERLYKESEGRPLLENKSEDELKEFIAIHLFERSYFYNKAKYTVVVDNKSVNEIANEIIKITELQ